MEWLRCRLLAVFSRVSSLGRLGWLGRNLVVSTCEKKTPEKGSLLGISHFYIHFRSTFSKQKPSKESIPPWTSQIFFEDVDICRPVDQTLGTPNGGLPGEA
jgi:hypothetical protein